MSFDFDTCTCIRRYFLKFAVLVVIEELLSTKQDTTTQQSVSTCSCTCSVHVHVHVFTQHPYTTTSSLSHPSSFSSPFLLFFFSFYMYICTCLCLLCFFLISFISSVHLYVSLHCFLFSFYFRLFSLLCFFYLIHFSSSNYKSIVTFSVAPATPPTPPSIFHNPPVSGYPLSYQLDSVWSSGGGNEVVDFSALQVFL